MERRQEITKSLHHNTNTRKSQKAAPKSKGKMRSSSAIETRKHKLQHFKSDCPYPTKYTRDKAPSDLKPSPSGGTKRNGFLEMLEHSSCLIDKHVDTNHSKPNTSSTTASTRTVSATVSGTLTNSTANTATNTTNTTQTNANINRNSNGNTFIIATNPYPNQHLISSSVNDQFSIHNHQGNNPSSISPKCSSSHFTQFSPFFQLYKQNSHQQPFGLHSHLGSLPPKNSHSNSVFSAHSLSSSRQLHSCSAGSASGRDSRAHASSLHPERVSNYSPRRNTESIRRLVESKIGASSYRQRSKNKINPSGDDIIKEQQQRNGSVTRANPEIRQFCFQRACFSSPKIVKADHRTVSHASLMRKDEEDKNKDNLPIQKERRKSSSDYVRSGSPVEIQMPFSIHGIEDEQDQAQSQPQEDDFLDQQLLNEHADVVLDAISFSKDEGFNKEEENMNAGKKWKPNKKLKTLNIGSRAVRRENWEKEEVKRIFRFEQFKGRICFDLLLDN